MSSAIWNYGIYLHGVNGDNGDAGSTWHSANRTAQAITIYGDASANTSNYAYGVVAQYYSPLTSQWGYNSFHLLASGLKDSANLATTPGGGINVIGIGSNNASWGQPGILWSWADAIAKDGPITFQGFSTDSAGSRNAAGIYFGVNNGVSNIRMGAMSTITNSNCKTFTTAAGNTLLTSRQVLATSKSRLQNLSSSSSATANKQWLSFQYIRRRNYSVIG
jgi:hypothetical protein